VGAASAAAITAATLSSLGFTAGGVAAGSVAAAIQAIIGNVAAGSLFAAAQSAGATGSLVAGFGVAGTAVAVAGVAVAVASAAALASFGVYKGVQHGYYKDVVKSHSKTQVLALLEAWSERSVDEIHRLLPTLEQHLVALKRVWEGLKKVLVKDFNWYEPVIGDGQFWYSKDKTRHSLPDLYGLAEHIKTICRTEEQILVDAAVELLTLWKKLLDIRASHEDEKERASAQDELIRVLPLLRGALVLLKRKWSKLKQKLQEKYEWDEPWIGDGTFVQLKEAKDGKGPEQLPQLAGLLEDILSVCNFAKL